MRYLLLSILVVSLVGILMVPSVFAAQYDVREGTSIEFKTNTVCDVSEELAYAKNNICKDVFEQLTDDFINIQWGNLASIWFVVTDVYDMGFATTLTMTMKDGSEKNDYNSYSFDRIPGTIAIPANSQVGDIIYFDDDIRIIWI